MLIIFGTVVARAASADIDPSVCDSFIYNAVLSRSTLFVTKGSPVAFTFTFVNARTDPNDPTALGCSLTYVNVKLCCPGSDGNPVLDRCTVLDADNSTDFVLTSDPTSYGAKTYPPVTCLINGAGFSVQATALAVVTGELHDLPVSTTFESVSQQLSVVVPPCYDMPPKVQPVPAQTDHLQQVIYFCGRIAGDSRMSACSEAGCASDVGFGSGDPNCAVTCGATCNKATVPLLPGQVNHITVCQYNYSCTNGGCVSDDLNGAPLVVQVAPFGTTPTVTPSPTPTRIACAGDCDANASVEVNEIMQCVNSALGHFPLVPCAACDVDDDGRFGIEDIIAAVNNALNGCRLFAVNGRSGA